MSSFLGMRHEERMKTQLITRNMTFAKWFIVLMIFTGFKCQYTNEVYEKLMRKTTMMEKTKRLMVCVCAENMEAILKRLNSI